MTEMHDWIRFWFRRNDHEFEEAATLQQERDQAAIEGGIPPAVLEACAHLDRERHQRNQFPIGAFFDSIDMRGRPGKKACTEKLFVAAEVGKELLHEAICTADEDDNVEFFVQAYEAWGPLVDTVLEECDRGYRDSRTGSRFPRQ